MPHFTPEVILTEYVQDEKNMERNPRNANMERENCIDYIQLTTGPSKNFLNQVGTPYVSSYIAYAYMATSSYLAQSSYLVRNKCNSQNLSANEATGQNLPANEAAGHPLVNRNKRKK